MAKSGILALPARDRTVIVILLFSAFVTFLNETIMGVALPTLMGEFKLAASVIQWLTTAFMLTLAIVIPVTGFLLERLSTRTMYLTAMSLFSLGTLLAGIAPNFSLLLVGRIVQASGTAIMMPLLMTTILNIVPVQQRGSVMGNMSIIMAVAPALGPTLSGLILQWLGWRWMFLLVLPIALLVAGLGMTKLRNVTEAVPTKLDVVSVILSALGFGGLVYGLSHVADSAGSRVPVWVAPAIGLVAVALFVQRQLRLQRTDSALLDLRTFRDRNFALGLSISLLTFVALMGSLIIMPIYLQDVRHLSVLSTGLLLLPGGLIMGLMGPFVGRWFDLVGPKPLMLPGSILAVLMLLAISRATAHTPVWLLLAIHVSLNIGLSLLFTPVFASSMNGLPPKLYPHGSALFGTLQQVAGAAGTALAVTIMELKRRALVNAGAPAADALASGVHWAFMLAGLMGVGVIVLALFVRRPPLADVHEPAVAHA